MSERMNRKRVRQSGQALTEYVLIVSVVMLVMVGSIAVFLGYVGDYYLNIMRVVCLPLP